MCVCVCVCVLSIKLNKILETLQLRINKHYIDMKHDTYTYKRKTVKKAKNEE